MTNRISLSELEALGLGIGNDDPFNRIIFQLRRKVLSSVLLQLYKANFRKRISNRISIYRQNQNTCEGIIKEYNINHWIKFVRKLQDGNFVEIVEGAIN